MWGLVLVLVALVGVLAAILIPSLQGARAGGG
jgi:type II secretory pathway pseudopilin PulG